VLIVPTVLDKGRTLKNAWQQYKRAYRDSFHTLWQEGTEVKSLFEAPARPKPELQREKTTMSPGEHLPDGTIFAGISPDTGRQMHTMPADVRKTQGDIRLCCTFNEAQKCAEGANAMTTYGHDDWRVPTKAELHVLFNNRAAIGGFDSSGSDPFDRYWSSSSYGTLSAWGQCFSDGHQNIDWKHGHSSVRLVR
jgi:hypothetical protein